jgi:hypothetical protein
MGRTPAVLAQALMPEHAPPRARLVAGIRRRWPEGVVAVALLVLALGYYYPLTFTDRILYDFDVWVFFYPLHQYGADALRAGRFPLWTPDIFLGSPFFANAQTALLYPLNLVFLLWPVPTAYAISLWLHTWLAALFTYLFARAALSFGIPAALVAALAFGYGGFITGLAGHINQLQAAAWLPLLALLLWQTITRGSLRRGALTGIVLAIQILAGHAQEAYHTLVALGLLTLLVAGGPRASRGEQPSLPTALSSWRPGLRALGRALGLYGFVVVLGLALAAVQLVPTAELQREGIRGGGLPYREAVSFSLPPPLLLQSLLPGFWRNPYGEYIGYIGTVPLALAVLALAVAPARWVLVGGVLAGVGLFLALGGYNPLYPLLYQLVPGLNLFRVPARWLFVYSFGAALLAGAGAEWLARTAGTPCWWDRLPRRRIVLVGGAAASALAVLLAITPPLGARRFYAAWAALGLLALALAALALWRYRRLALALLALATAGELIAASAPAAFRDAIPADAYRSARPAVAAVLADRDGYRLLSLARDDYGLGEIAANRFPYPDLPPRVIENYAIASKHNEVLTPNLPLEYGLSTVDGYDGGVLPLRRWVDLARLLVTEDEPRLDGVLRHRLHYLPDERLLNLLGVRWIITSTLRDATVDGVPFDRLVTRRLRPGERFELAVAAQPAAAVALLSSVAGDLPEGATVGRLTVAAADGRAETFDLRLGRHTGRAVPASQAGTVLPIAPPPDPRLPNVDYLARLPLAGPTPVARLTFENVAPAGTWLVRGATLLAPDGQAEPLLLSEALERVPHDDPAPVKVYRNRAALPPVFLVPEVRVADDADALAFLRSPAYAPERVAVVAPGPAARPLPGGAEAGTPPPATMVSPAPGQQPPGSESAGGTVRVVERAPERWVLETEAPAERLLVFTQAFFPGWTATLDGTTVPIVRANYLFQGLYVPPGRHRIELAYRPGSLLLGALLSLAGLAVAGAALALDRPRWPWPRRAGARSSPYPPSTTQMR